MSIGKKILALRRKLDLSQEQMAQDLHVSRQTISKWESDLSLPDMKTVLLMSELYDISVTELLGVEDSKDDSITELYNQLHLVNKNLESAKKRRTIFDIVLIVICIVCLSLTSVILLKRNNTNVVQNYYEYEYGESETRIEKSEIKVLSYDLDKNLINVEIITEVSNGYKGSQVKCHLKDMQGKEYNYQLDNNETYDKYVYKGAIPLKDYNEGSISLTCDKEVLIDSIAVENYLAQIMDRFIYISMFTEEKGGYIYSNMGKLTYQFRDFWNNNEIDIKGTIQGNAHITIKGENNNICYFDKTIPIGTNQVFDLKEPLQHLQVIDFMCVFQIDGTEYKINHSIKIIEGPYTYKDNRFMNFIKEGDF